MDDKKYITHLTLTTGHVRRSYRHEVSDDVIAPVYGLIADALASGKRVPIPNFDGYEISAQSGARRAVLISVYNGPHLLASFGVAKKQAKSLWASLVESHCTVSDIDPGKEPQEPWVASILWGALDDDLDAAMWIGDFERVAAWAWWEG